MTEKRVGVIRSDESEGMRFGKLMAECYYFMAKHIMDEMGEEKGSELIEAALKEFGEARVASIKEEAAEKGIEVKNFEDYFTVRDMPDCGWINGEERGVVLQCLFDEVWKKYEADEQNQKIRQLYCDIDYTLYGGFGFDLYRPECKAAGHDKCVFKFTYK